MKDDSVAGNINKENEYCVFTLLRYYLAIPQSLSEYLLGI